MRKSILKFFQLFFVQFFQFQLFHSVTEKKEVIPANHKQVLNKPSLVVTRKETQKWEQ